ncbi:MAG: TIGR04283 family arsenosugar biosynthesis glycosyltransferase [Myxococcota bacterium]
MNVSVIIPVLDEAAGLEAQLRRLIAIGDFHEIIVVDGGSRDGTLDTARAVARDHDVRVLSAERGRGRQMNAGAKTATGDVLLFLHADVVPPADVVDLIRDALKDPKTVAGAFVTWTVPAHGGVPLGPLLHLADIRSRYADLPYGDQGLFVRAEVFCRLGGYTDIPLMEDLELAQRLRDVGCIARVPARVHVSGRRFQARPIRYTLMVNLYPLLFRAGVSPDLLARFYGPAR